MHVMPLISWLGQWSRVLAAFCVMVVSGCTSDAEMRTWTSITVDGDKPGFAIVLSEKGGKVMDGSFPILDPNDPHVLSKGSRYDLTGLRQEGRVVTATVTIDDASAPTGKQIMEITMISQEGFRGDRLGAQLRSGPEGPRLIIFSRSGN